MSRLPCRCWDCDGCAKYYRWQKGRQYEEGMAGETQSMVRISGFQSVDELAHYRDLGAHSTRSTYGKKRITLITPEGDTYKLAMIFDGEMTEKQRRLTVTHAKRYGHDAEVSIGRITREQFEDNVPAVRSLERESTGPRGENSCFTTHFTGWGAAKLNDYSNGKSFTRRRTQEEGPLLKAEIPEEIAEKQHRWRTLRDQGDPSWHDEYEEISCHFSQGWVEDFLRTQGAMQQHHLQPHTDLYCWDGPDTLLKDAGRYLVDKELWRPCFRYVLEAVGLEDLIPADDIEQPREDVEPENSWVITEPEPDWYLDMYDDEVDWSTIWRKLERIAA